MVEIVILWLLCKRIAKVARANQRSPGNYQMLLIALWFAGEITAAIVGTILTGSVNVLVYVIALLGAVVGSAIAFKRASRKQSDLLFQTSRAK